MKNFLLTIMFSYVSLGAYAENLHFTGVDVPAHILSMDEKNVIAQAIEIKDPYTGWDKMANQLKDCIFKNNSIVDNPERVFIQFNQLECKNKNFSIKGIVFSPDDKKVGLPNHFSKNDNIKVLFLEDIHEQ